jgi:hypothetical protein
MPDELDCECQLFKTFKYEKFITMKHKPDPPY